MFFVNIKDNPRGTWRTQNLFSNDVHMNINTHISGNDVKAEKCFSLKSLSFLMLQCSLPFQFSVHISLPRYEYNYGKFNIYLNSPEIHSHLHSLIPSSCALKLLKLLFSSKQVRVSCSTLNLIFFKLIIDC